MEVSDKMSPEELVKLWTTLNPDTVTIKVWMKAEVLTKKILMF